MRIASVILLVLAMVVVGNAAFVVDETEQVGGDAYGHGRAAQPVFDVSPRRCVQPVAE